MTQFSFLKSLKENAVGSLQQDLKHADMTDAGKYDVSDKAQGNKDVSFNMMRNTINADGEITGSDVADYIERAEELNDEVETIAYGLETDDGNIVKVYVNANESDKFEEALTQMLGVEEDIEETINKLAAEYDIVDVVWPTDPNDSGTIAEPDEEAVADVLLPGDNENGTITQMAGTMPTTILGPEDDDDDDDFDVIAALPGTDASIGNTMVPRPTIPGLDNAFKQQADASGAVQGDGTEDAESLPDVEDKEEGNIWAKLNDIAIEMFGKDDDSEVLGVGDLSRDQLGQILKIDDADEIATNQYDGADFQSLEPDEQQEIVLANPDLIIDHDEDEGDEEGAIDTEAAVDKAGLEDVEKVEDEGEDVENSIPESKKRFSFLSSL